MPAQAAIFRQCIDEAVRTSSQLLSCAVDDAIAALAEAENRSTKASSRHELSDASRELLRQRASWIERYPRELRQALEAAPPQAAANQRLPERLETLTLVNDDKVDQEIESSRLSQLLQSVVAQPLGELDGLVSSLLGLPAVRPEENPFRPDVFARVLRAVMADAAQQPGWPALWSRHMAPALGRELEQLYLRLTKLLTAADVHAAGYRVLPIRTRPHPAGPRVAQEPAPWTPARPPGDPASGASASDDRPEPRPRAGSGWADLTSYPSGDALIQDFLFHGASHGDAPLAPAYYARVSNDLARLEAAADDEAPVSEADVAQHYAQLPAVDRPLRHVSTDTTLSRDRWGAYGASRQRSLVRTRLKKEARHADQVLGLEVVRKLVNQVAVDARLLAPVRESIVALEPSLLRLAMVDPRFFSDEEHPGRRLLERVADRSLKFNDEFSTEFRDFSSSVAASFNGLNALGDGAMQDAGPFRSALAALEASWTAQDSAEQEQRKSVLDAVRFAEQRQAAADQIAWELSQRADLEDVPAVVQDFVYGPWALVMAHARLTATGRQIDPGGHGSVVTDLLWSVKRDVTLRDPARLIDMVPGLLNRLRSGLGALGQGPQESESFFQSLEQMHRPVLRLRAKKRRDDSDFAPIETGAELPRPEPAPRQPPKPVHSPWMGRQELDAAGFQDTLPTNHAELTEAGGQAAHAHADERDDGPTPGSRPVEVDALIARLGEGCWVDLYSRRHWLRAQLVWASTKGTLFMFVSHGGQPHSMTRRSCERLLRDRLLRPVEMHGAVSHAIGVIAQTQSGFLSEPPARQPAHAG
ncbi:MAG: hypothetical protein JWQ33_2383 [Ramlibacter sp.]|nr:hypothetical protein [Ramlibacter sp.]